MGHKVIWRFFSRESGWSWQQLATDGSVIAESPAPYCDYDLCIAAAANEGYVHQASQERIVRPGGGMRWEGWR